MSFDISCNAISLSFGEGDESLIAMTNTLSLAGEIKSAVQSYLDSNPILGKQHLLKIYVMNMLPDRSGSYTVQFAGEEIPAFHIISEFDNDAPLLEQLPILASKLEVIQNV